MKLITTLAVAAVIAPTAFAGTTPAPAGKTDAMRASALCKTAAKADQSGWDTFAAKYAKGMTSYVVTYGKNAKNGKTPLGRCVSAVATKLAAERKAAEPAAQPPAATTSTATTSSTVAPDQSQKATVEECKQAVAASKAKAIGECMKAAAGGE